MSQAARTCLLGYTRGAAAGALLGLLAMASHAQAQSSVTASRTVALAAFAGAQGVHPEYGSSPNLYGFMIGADATRYFRLASPSLEVRFNDASGSALSQRTFLVGLKVEHAFGRSQRFHPYLDGLIGSGTIHFPNPVDPTYTHDESLVPDLGAGLDVDLTRHFAVKGDFQIQHWHLGKEQPVFSPEVVSVGLVYRPTFGKLSIR